MVYDPYALVVGDTGVLAQALADSVQFAGQELYFCNMIGGINGTCGYGYGDVPTNRPWLSGWSAYPFNRGDWLTFDVIGTDQYGGLIISNIQPA